MQKTLLNIVMAALCLNFSAYSQDRSTHITALKIGDKLPDITINNIINYKRTDGKPATTAKISDFKGKLLILDFWATWCSPCVAIIPKMDSLQKQLDGKLQFLSVTYQTANEVNTFMAKFNRQQHQTYDIPELVNDKLLNNLFPHSSLPHFIWIDQNGVVRAITDQNAVNLKNINDLLTHQEINVPLKQEITLLPYDRSMPLFTHQNTAFDSTMIFRSELSGCVEGLRSGYHYDIYEPGKPRRITARNMPIMALFSNAYGGQYKTLGNHKVLLDVQDSTALNSSKSGAAYHQWLFANHGFCYELIVPPLLAPNIFSIMQSDLGRLFPQYKAKVELMERECWVLTRTSATDKIKTTGSERFFHGRPYLDHSCYIQITKKPGERKAANSGYSGLMRKSIAPRQTTDGLLFQDFLEKAGAFERILSDSGFVKMHLLSDDELAGTKSKAGFIEQYLFLQGENERPILKDVHLKDEIRIGNNHCQLFALSDVEDLPSLCGSRVNYDKYSTDKTKFSVGFASPLGLLLDCNHCYNQYIFIGDAQQTMKGMEKKRLRLQSLSAYSRENAIARDATSDFLNEAISEQRLPVKAHFNVFAWTDHADGIQEVRNKVGSAMAQMDAVARQESDGAPQIWWAGIPGNAADFPLNDTFDTFLEQATCFLNVESNYRSSPSGFGIRLGDRLSGRPVNADISDEPMKKGYITNRNKMILGPSGSGKSFFTNHLNNGYYEQDTHVVIVDVGHSYQGLCELANGYYFTYSEDNPIRFNPFYIAKCEVLDIEKKESLKTLLLALWKKDDEGYTRSEYVAISNAITLYYVYLKKNPKVFPGFNSFYDFLMAEYLQVLQDGKVSEKDFNMSNFLYVLNPYYKNGEYDYLLNATENLDLLNERFIVFELDNIKSHEILFPVVTIIIMEVFISKMRKLPKNVRKVILIEEAWKAIAKEGMADYIRYLFKTVRKFFGEAIVVTQEVEDILSSPIIKQAIVNNSDCKILLDQSKYQNKFDDVQALLGLTEKEKALILSMNKANDPDKKYKEVFISLGGQYSKVYRTEVSPEAYWAYTTEASEKGKVQDLAQQLGGMEKAIAAIVAEQQSTKQKPSN